MARKIASLVVMLVAASQFISAQGAASIQGAWRVTEVVVTGAGASSNKAPQPGIYIFTKQHYSIMLVRGSAPRKAPAAAANPEKLTDAEKLARFDVYDPFTANSGTYEVKGTTLAIHPAVAKNPGVMGSTQTSEFKLEGNTLTLVSKSAAGQPVSQTTTKLTRIE